MPYNPLLYPADLPSALSTGPSVVELAVLDLQQQSESAAIRQMQARRSSGRTNAVNQNASLLSVNALMPLAIVAGDPVPVVLGTRGYWFGGSQNAWVSSTVSIDRLNYSTETVSALGLSSSPSAAFAAAGASSSANGYSAGGFGFARLPISSIDKLVFSTEALSALAATLTLARWDPAAVNSSTNAYFASGAYYGGGTIPLATVIDRLVLSNETVSALGAALTTGRNRPANVTSTTHGYFTGGLITGAVVASIERLAFSGETVSTIAATLSAARGVSASASSSTSGYTAGGLIVNVGGSIATLSVIDRLVFSTEANTALGSSLSLSRGMFNGCQSSISGYFGGGSTDGVGSYNFATIDRLAFSGEVANALGATLSTPRHVTGTLSNYNPSNG